MQEYPKATVEIKVQDANLCLSQKSHVLTVITSNYIKGLHFQLDWV